MARLLLLTTDDDARDAGAPVRTIGELLNDLCDELDTGRKRPPGPTPDDAAAIAGFLGLTRRQTAHLQGWLKSNARRRDTPSAAESEPAPAERREPVVTGFTRSGAVAVGGRR